MNGETEPINNPIFAFSAKSPGHNRNANTADMMPLNIATQTAFGLGAPEILYHCAHANPANGEMQMARMCQKYVTNKSVTCPAA